MIKTVLFDMDGVLLDTEKVYNLCWRKAGLELGYDLNMERSLSIRSLNAVDGRKTFAEWFGSEKTYDLIRNRRKELMAEYFKTHSLEVKKGAEKTLRWLRDYGYKTSLVTATRLELAIPQLKEAGLYGLLDQYVSAREVQHGKPHPDPYLYACEKIGERPEDCYAVEDSPNGILSAFRAGCKTIMIPDLTQPDAETEKYITVCLNKIGELPDYLIKTQY